MRNHVRNFSLFYLFKAGRWQSKILEFSIYTVLPPEVWTEKQMEKGIVLLTTRWHTRRRQAGFCVSMSIFPFCPVFQGMWVFFGVCGPQTGGAWVTPCSKEQPVLVSWFCTSYLLYVEPWGVQFNTFVLIKIKMSGYCWGQLFWQASTPGNWPLITWDKGGRGGTMFLANFNEQVFDKR
jgi:hypothetical protein